MHTPCQYPSGVVDVTADVYGNMGNGAQLPMLNDWLCRLSRWLQQAHPLCYFLPLPGHHLFSQPSALVDYNFLDICGSCRGSSVWRHLALMGHLLASTFCAEHARSGAGEVIMMDVHARDHHNVESQVFERFCGWWSISHFVFHSHPHTLILEWEDHVSGCYSISKKVRMQWCKPSPLPLDFLLPWKSCSGPQPNLHRIVNASVTLLLTFIPVQFLSAMRVRVLQIEHFALFPVFILLQVFSAKETFGVECILFRSHYPVAL